MASEPASTSEEERRTSRHSFNAEVHFRSGQKRANVRISDISTHGARVHGVFLVRDGDAFFIRLPGMESIEAKVAWVEDFQFGCEFASPLSPIVVDNLLQRG